MAMTRLQAHQALDDQLFVQTPDGQEGEITRIVEGDVRVSDTWDPVRNTDWWRVEVLSCRELGVS